MARIGDYIDAGLNTYDPSPYLQASGDASRSIGASIGAGIGAIGDVVKDRRDKKDTIKTSKELAKAMATLYPEAAGALEPIIGLLDDEETPLSQRAALGAQIGEFINMGVQQSRDKAMLDLEGRGMKIREDQFAIDKEEAETRSKMLADELDKRNKDESLRDQTAAAIAPGLLNQVLQQTAAMEQSGQQVGIPSKTLQDALNAAEPGQQMQIAEAALAMLPKSAQEQINFNTPVTIDGQPGTAATAYDPSTGRMRIVPIDDAISQGIDGIFSVTTTNYSQGAAAGGPDEMQDKWTNKGYSSTGKNLTKGVVAVNDSVFPLGTVFRDANSGEVFIAADRHGNKDASVVDFYQPPGEYEATKGKRTLEVIGTVKPATTPEGIQAQIAQFQGKKPGVTAGAVKVKPETIKETPEEALAKARMMGADARLTETLRGADTLAGTIDNLNQTEKLLDEVRTGFGAEAVVKAKRMLGADVANAEQLQTLLGDQVMARVAQTKGAVSEKEMELFQQYSANFGKTPEGNKKIVQFAKKAAERAKKISKVINDGFQSGKSPFEIQSAIIEIQNNEPISDALSPPSAKMEDEEEAASRLRAFGQ
jgi:3D (Asp-Asp-Asp) domain-containing protein